MWKCVGVEGFSNLVVVLLRKFRRMWEAGSSFELRGRCYRIAFKYENFKDVLCYVRSEFLTKFVVKVSALKNTIDSSQILFFSS